MEENPIKTDQLLSKKGHGSKLGVKAEVFSIALIEEKSVIAAARKAGISEATAYRWMKDPEFGALLKLRRDEVFTQNVTRLTGMVSRALDTLENVMLDETQDSRVRVLAAVQLFRLAIQARETLELSDRVAALEATMDGEVEA